MWKVASLVALLILTLPVSGALVEVRAFDDIRVLIISNESDLKSSELLTAWLSDKQIPHEISDRPMPGFNFYIVLGGPKARVTGQLALKYIPERERFLLLNQKGYWTFHVTTEGRSTFVLIAGSTRKETFEATEILIERGILDFIVSEGSGLNIPYEKGPSQRRDFKWSFPPISGKEFSLSVDIPEELVDFYRVKPRMRVAELSSENGSLIFTWYLMMRTPHDDELLERMKNELIEIAEKNGIKGYDRVWFIASFVQHLKYSLANEYSPTGDHPSYPVETLFDGRGDCEDLSMLLISLLREAGFDSILLVMPGHAAVAVAMPPDWVKLPRVKASIERLGGVEVALVDLLDLWDILRKGEVPFALEFRLGNRSYFYLESTGFFRPGELPNILHLAESIRWPYRNFPIFLVRDEGSPVPLIYDYLFLSRKVDSGYLITVIVKIKNAGDGEARELRLESQIYPGSKVEVGGIDAKLRRLGELAGVRVSESESHSSLILGPIGPGGSSIHSFTFHTPSPTVGARLSLYLGSSEVDFLRIRPFNP
ncbi:MAG: transglutaminase-like domain-containing protein [Candidatus Korarchaeum sp.]